MTAQVGARLLRWARHRAGMTQRDLAEAAGMPQPSIARIEAGVVGARVETLTRLLRATGHELSVDVRIGATIDPEILREPMRKAPHARIRSALKVAHKAGSRRPDQIRVLRRMRRYGVRFVLIGDLAAMAHGAVVSGASVAICYRRDRDNNERLMLALADLGAVPRPDGRALESADTLAFSTDAGSLDVVAAPPGTNGFADLDANASELLVATGLIVRVAALDDLIRVRRGHGDAAGAGELEMLGAVRDELDSLDLVLGITR